MAVAATWPGGPSYSTPGSHDALSQLLIADAQTSGGLVFGVDPGQTDSVLAALADSGHTAARIGSTAGGAPGFKLA